MLAVSDARGAGLAASGLDAGAVATAIARLWADAGRDVLVVDADAHGAGLSGRIGATTRLALQPAQRGLPSLIASRSPLSAQTVARHCWLLPTEAGGSISLLGAPAHPDGARRAASWLADRCEDLAELAQRWAVIVSMPGPAAPPYEPLTRAASQRLELAVVAGTAPPGGMRALLGAFWLRFAPFPQIRLLAAGPEEKGRDSSAVTAPIWETSAPLTGGTGRARAAVLLGARPRGRDRVLLEALAGAAGRLGAAADRAEEPATPRVGTNGLAARRCGGAAGAVARSQTPGRSPTGASS